MEPSRPRQSAGELAASETACGAGIRPLRLPWYMPIRGSYWWQRSSLHRRRTRTSNRATPELFRRYPNPVVLAHADPAEVEEVIFSTGFYRQKTRSIIDLSRDLIERFDGIVPSTIEELVELRGVGRKTASVVLAEAFGQAAIAVDTHVRRLSIRLGLSTNPDPAKIEVDLKSVFPPGVWGGLSMRLIQFGRDVCVARAPRCFECDLVDLCPFPDKTSPVA